MFFGGRVVKSLLKFFTLVVTSSVCSSDLVIGQVVCSLQLLQA